MASSCTRPDIDIFGLSLTEILLLVAFLFLVVMTHLDQKARKAEAMQKDGALVARHVDRASLAALEVEERLFGGRREAPPGADVAAQAELVADVLDRLREGLDSPEARRELENASLPEIWNTLEMLRDDLERTQARNEALLREIKDGGALVAELDRLKAEREKLEEILADLRGKAREQLLEAERRREMLRGAGVATLEDLVRSYANARGQVADLRHRAGVGEPSCWTTPEGKFEFLYHIAIHEDGFVVRPAWPEHRARDVRGLGGPVVGAGGRRMSPEEFRRAMAPLWAWGRAHDSCRFFVRVTDRTSPVSKLTWQRSLQLVEDVFYKQVVSH